MNVVGFALRSGCLLTLIFARLLAQSLSFALTGDVTDRTSAAVPGAIVTLYNASGAPAGSARTDAAGVFQIPGAPPGTYRLEVQNPGFAPASVSVRVGNRVPAPVHVRLELAGMREEVTVTGSATEVGTDSSQNMDVVTLDREDLDNLPIFDQDYVSAMSRFLDPGSISTGGVTLVVDGVEQSSVGVSASAIQQVKINQNPYSAEFSRPGRGRIEVITKPGSQVYHGTLIFFFRDYHLNARDPFALTRPPEQRRLFEGSLIGPLGRSGKTSFLLSANRAEEDLQATVYASLPSGIFQTTVANPHRELDLAAGITHAFSDGHLGSIRGNYSDQTEQNRGVGGLVLPEAGVNFENREDQIFYNDSLVISPKTLNQFRIMFGRQHTPTTSITDAPSIVVGGAFTGGGAQGDRLQTENHINLNDIVSFSKGKHEIRTGINVPDISRRGLDDHTNFGGTYSFASLQDYQNSRPYSLIQQQGDGHVVFIETVVGGFIQDDYRMRPNLALSAGIRYDWQNFFHDNNNVAPRVSFAYSPGKHRKTVLRGGAGFFYDRTGPGPIFDLERYNGVRLRQVVISNPAYPSGLDDAALALYPTSITRLDPTVRMPYTGQFSFGVEHQLRKDATISVTYWGTRGVSLFRSRDVNAPPPPYYLLRPDPTLSVYRQIESSGRLQNDALEFSFRGRIARRFNGMVQYTLGRALNDVAGNYSGGTRSTGINAFPANNYDLSGEWARADYDQRHRLNVLGTIHAAKYLDFGLGLYANTGAPYTMTTGRDDYRTGYANARPPGVPRNSLEGPGMVELDLRWSHDFRLNSKKEGPRLTTALDAFNVTNTVSYPTYVGNLSSPFFGEPISARPPRRLQLSVRFAF
jgi:hypothetical protein